MKYLNSKKLFFICFFIFIFTFLFSDFSLAQGRELEIDYPAVPGVAAPTSVRTPLPEYIRYIFSFSIMIAGLIAFGSIIFGGVRYLTSAGNPNTMADSKDQIFAGLLGIIILLASYLILTTINPQLVIINPEFNPGMEGVLLTDGGGNEYFAGTSLANIEALGFTPTNYVITDPNDVLDVYTYSNTNYQPVASKTLIEGAGGLGAVLSIELKWKPYGVYLCQDSQADCRTAQECVPYMSSSASLDELVDDDINCIYAKQFGNTRYRIVLHENQNYEGDCGSGGTPWYYETDATGTPLDLSGNAPNYTIRASSIHIFRQSTDMPGDGVTLFDVKDYNQECGAGCFKTCAAPSCGDDCAPESGFMWNVNWGPGECWNYKDTEQPNLNETGNSILIEPDGRYMAVLFENQNYGGKCEVFTRNDPFLEDNYIRDCVAAGWGFPFFTQQWRGCFGSVIIKPIR